MAQSMIPPPAAMLMRGDLSSNFKFFRDCWSNYRIATGLVVNHGKDCYEVYENLPLSEDERKNQSTILEKLGEHFEPLRNTIYERYMFNSAMQSDGESIEQFLSKLRKLAATCQYGSLLDEMLRDRIVIGVHNSHTRARLLREKGLTLQKAYDICRSSEVAENQVKTLEGESVNYVKHKKSDMPIEVKACIYCGSDHNRGKCPAYCQSCQKCGKQNRFAKVCRSTKASAQDKSVPGGDIKSQKKHYQQHGSSTAPRQKVFQFDSHVDENDQSSDDSIYTVQGDEGNKRYFVKLLMSTQKASPQKKIRFQLDSGASCSTIKEEDYYKITNAPLEPSNATLSLYDRSTIKPIGSTTLYGTVAGVTKKIRFQVIKNAPVSLLSGRACEALQLMKFKQEFLLNQISTTETDVLTKEQVLTEYKDIFTGLGKLPGSYHIEMEPNTAPVQSTRRRVPIPLRSELKAKLTELESQGIIARVTSPTPWISNLVAVKRPEKLRLCLDPSELNKCIRRNHYPTRTVDDVTSRLANAKLFSVLDAKDGFLQIVLDEESSFLTTFWTPIGRFRWLRMPFGIKSAPEEFQRRLDECLEGLSNVEVIADDILLFGTGETLEEAEKSHDAAMRALLQRCRERGVKLNTKKLRFKLQSVSYLGHVISSEGLSPDPEKVRAITEMPPPTDVRGVQRLLGMVTYLSRFMPQLSSICEPLRRLTDDDSKFEWLDIHSEAMDTLKRVITKAPVLKHYDEDKEVCIECDCSDVGIGAVITQDDHPVAYASRALTSTERNYAQIEKECLSIVFATEKFEQYILGKNDVVVLTDHKPLMSIFTKPILSSPKRLQRMRLRLQKYSLRIQYKPGPSMYISDTLSRAYLPLQTTEVDTPPYMIFQLERQTKFRDEIAQIDMEQDLFVTDERLLAIRLETRKDTSLQTLMSVIVEGWPDVKSKLPLCVREFWDCKDELVTQNGLVFRGTRIVIPTGLRGTMISRAHASHMGINTTLKTAKSIMFWPRMNAEISDAVLRCSACQEHQPAQQKEPLMTYPIPTLPWQIIASDCFEVRGQHYCVLVDCYSDYIELFQLEDMTSATLIRQLKPVFATHGVPSVLISDNGPNYSSADFKAFCDSWSFKHITSSPHHHQANGKAESAVKIMKNMIRKTQATDGDIWKAVLEWRNAPSPNTESSPAQRFFSRRTRSLLPANDTAYQPKVITNVLENIVEKRRKSKVNYDKSAKPLPELVVGQPIRALKHPKSSSSPWVPGVVTSKVAPRSYLIQVGDRTYRRNRIHLRDAIDNPQLMPQTLDAPSTVTASDNQPPSEEQTSSVPQDPPNLQQLQHPQSTRSPTQPVSKTTRSGRVSKMPEKYNDYVCNE